MRTWGGNNRVLWRKVAGWILDGGLQNRIAMTLLKPPRMTTLWGGDEACEQGAKMCLVMGNHQVSSRDRRWCGGEMAWAGRKFHIVFSREYGGEWPGQANKEKGGIVILKKNKGKFCDFLKMPMASPSPTGKLRHVRLICGRTQGFATQHSEALC